MGVQSMSNKTSYRPRRRRRKRSVWRKTVWPLLKFSVVIAVSAFLVIAFGCKVIRPFCLLSREQKDTQHLANQLAAIKKENSELERRIQFLATDKGAMQAARKLGYVKPGEITIILPKEEPKTTQNIKTK